MKPSSLLALALALTLALPASAFAADKTNLIEELIPEDLKDIGKTAGEILGAYSGISGAADTVEALLSTFGIIHPSMGPDMQDLFEDLTEHLDSIAGSLDWKIDATARAERYGKMMSSVDAIMTAMDTKGSLSSSLKANAETNSSAVLNEIKAPSGVSFQRLYVNSVTSGNWKNFVSDRPTVSNGQVYDWRLGVPELLEFVALRQQVMSAVVPDWKAKGTYKTEMMNSRAFLKQQYDKMNAGVKCASLSQSDCSLANAEYCVDSATLTITCADIYTGSFDQSVFVGIDFENQKLERVGRDVKRKMPLYEMRAMMDTLFAYANPAQESMTSAGSIWAAGSPGSTLLCLDVKGGNSASGTPVQLWPCNYTAAQTWTYDRQNGTIYNPKFRKCLDVRGGSNKSGTQVQIWGCNGTDSQRWTFDPEKHVVENALGTVLDVQWGAVAKGTPVWTWSRAENSAQRWNFPDIYDAIVRCTNDGTC